MIWSAVCPYSGSIPPFSPILRPSEGEFRLFRPCKAELAGTKALPLWRRAGQGCEQQQDKSAESHELANPAKLRTAGKGQLMPGKNWAGWSDNQQVEVAKLAHEILLQIRLRIRLSL